MQSIHQVHRRRFTAPYSQILSALEVLYSDTALDAFPRDYLRPWRTNPRGFKAGDRFGHGPIAWEVVSWDERTLVTIPVTPGLGGQTIITLEPASEHVIITHIFEGRLGFVSWLVWKLLFARSHDWAVEAVFDRMDLFFETGQMPEVTPIPPPALIRLPKLLRRLMYRLLGSPSDISPEANRAVQ